MLAMMRPIVSGQSGMFVRLIIIDNASTIASAIA